MAAIELSVEDIVLEKEISQIEHQADIGGEIR